MVTSIPSCPSKSLKSRDAFSRPLIIEIRKSRRKKGKRKNIQTQCWKVTRHFLVEDYLRRIRWRVCIVRSARVHRDDRGSIATLACNRTPRCSFILLGSISSELLLLLSLISFFLVKIYLFLSHPIIRFNDCENVL